MALGWSSWSMVGVAVPARAVLRSKALGAACPGDETDNLVERAEVLRRRLGRGWVVSVPEDCDRGFVRIGRGACLRSGEAGSARVAFSAEGVRSDLCRCLSSFGLWGKGVERSFGLHAVLEAD